MKIICCCLIIQILAFPADASFIYGAKCKEGILIMADSRMSIRFNPNISERTDLYTDNCQKWDIKDNIFMGITGELNSNSGLLYSSLLKNVSTEHPETLIISLINLIEDSLTQSEIDNFYSKNTEVTILGFWNKGIALINYNFKDDLCVPSLGGAMSNYFEIEDFGNNYDSYSYVDLIPIYDDIYKKVKSTHKDGHGISDNYTLLLMKPDGELKILKNQPLIMTDNIFDLVCKSYITYFGIKSTENRIIPDKSFFQKLGLLGCKE